MHSLDRVRLLGSAFFSRTVHLHGLATAAAMLTCVAVVLNVGPFARTPKTDGLTANREAARTVMEQPNGSNSFPQSGVRPEDISEPITALIQPSSISVVEVSPLATQAVRPKDGDAEMEGQPPPQSPGSADSARQPHQDYANPDLMKRDTFVGVWAPDVGTCSARDFREGVLPTVISTDGAWAGETFCMFTNKKQMETGWTVVAKCSNPRERWTSKLRLTVNDNRLTWTSKRGTQAYTRCAPDVLMAQAR